MINYGTVISQQSHSDVRMSFVRWYRCDIMIYYIKKESDNINWKCSRFSQ